MAQKQISNIDTAWGQAALQVVPPTCLQPLCGGSSAAADVPFVRRRKSNEAADRMGDLYSPQASRLAYIFLHSQFLQTCLRAALLCGTGNVVMILLWLVAAGLAVYVSKSAVDVRRPPRAPGPALLCLAGRPGLTTCCTLYVQVQPFDPYEILNVEKGASEKEVKRAYRQASLKYHPDKVHFDLRLAPL